MKNKILNILILLLFMLESNLSAGELEINSSKIKHDNENKITIFQG